MLEIQKRFIVMTKLFILSPVLSIRCKLHNIHPGSIILDEMMKWAKSCEVEECPLYAAWATFLYLTVFNSTNTSIANSQATETMFSSSQRCSYEYNYLITCRQINQIHLMGWKISLSKQPPKFGWTDRLFWEDQTFGYTLDFAVYFLMRMTCHHIYNLCNLNSDTLMSLEAGHLGV